MIGYPYYNTVADKKKVYVSDFVVSNSKYFTAGLMLSVVTSSSVAFANELTNVPSYTPSPSPTPNGNVPTGFRNVVQGGVAIAGCGAASKTCTDVVNQAAKHATDKLSTVNSPSVGSIALCVFLAGYCAGKATTYAIDKGLGFIK